MDEPNFGHTSPIYVAGDGQSIFQRESAEALLADMESALKTIPAKSKFSNDAQREEVLNIYREGIAMLRRRLGL